MINVTISPDCGCIGLETEIPRVRVVCLVWEWVVCDIETLFYEEDLIFAYESQGPPWELSAVNCNYSTQVVSAI
jgi:hypothetical protein